MFVTASFACLSTKSCAIFGFKRWSPSSVSWFLSVRLFGTGSSPWSWRLYVHCRMWNSVPGSYPRDTRRTQPTHNTSRHSKISPRGQNHPNWESSFYVNNIPLGRVLRPVSGYMIHHEHTEFPEEPYSQTIFRADKNSGKGILRGS